MSGPTVHLITNAKGSGDWCIITVEGEVIYEGHSIGFCHLKDIFDATYGYEYLYYHELTDEQMENWQEAIYED